MAVNAMFMCARPAATALMKKKALFLLACFALAPLDAHRSRELGKQGEIEARARGFQEVALHLMKDDTTDRERAIDLYWEARAVAGRKGSTQQRRRAIGELYQQLQGGRIARAALAASGFRSSNPAEPLVLTQGKLYSHLLLVVSNRTRRARDFSIGSAEGSLSVIEESVSLQGGESTGVFIRFMGPQAGAFQAKLGIRSGGHSTRILLEGEVRRSGRLAVRLFDTEDRPTAARVYLNGADGASHIPEGSFGRVMWMSGEHYFHADGLLQAELPTGRATVEVVKGFEYFPFKTEVSIEADRTTWLNVRLRRLEDMRAYGWYSGDEHIHGNYRGDQIIKPEDNSLVIRGENLSVGNLMVSNSDGAYVHDENYFVGRKPHPLSDREHVFYWNQEMRNRNMYGHLILLNLKELVRPIYTGFPNTPNWEDYPSNYQQAKKAKDQGGYVSYAHPMRGFDEIPTGVLARESVVDVALGVIDALEVFCGMDEPSMALWYTFLNLGFPLSISAGSDAFINQTFSTLAGGERVYVQAGKEFTYDQWVEGLSRGRVFATVGPLLFFEVDGEFPGHEFRFEKGPAVVGASARVVSWMPVTKLEIVANGEVIESVSSKSPTNRLEWQGALSFERSSWVGARVWGPEHRLIANGPSRWAQRQTPLVLMAHSGVSWVYLPDSPIVSEKERAFCLRWIDTLVEDVMSRAQFVTEERRQEVIDVFLKARRVYQRMGP